MKKLYAVLFVALALYTSPAFAEKQYIKYAISGGEIKAMGSMPDMDAEAGEEISVIEADIPKEELSNFTFNRSELKLVRKDQAVIDKAKAERDFSVVKLTTRLGEAFVGESAIDLAPYLGALQSYAEARNFKGIYAFGLGLVAKQKATQEQVTKIFGLFLEQGINLADYSA